MLLSMISLFVSGTVSTVWYFFVVFFSFYERLKGEILYIVNLIGGLMVDLHASSVVDGGSNQRL